VRASPLRRAWKTRKALVSGLMNNFTTVPF
jgi:hypothetical protein